MSSVLLCSTGAEAEAIARVHWTSHSAGVWTKAGTYMGDRLPGSPSTAVASGLSTTPDYLFSSSTPTIVVSKTALRCLTTTGASPSLGPKGTLMGLQCLSVPGLPAVPSKPAKKGKRAKRPSVSPEVLAQLAVDRTIALAGKPGLRISPARVGLTGLDSYFWVAPPPGPVVARASVPGITVTARAHPVQFVWHFGDGGEMATSGAGRPWTRSHPGSIAHQYQARGRYSVSVQVLWIANWRIGQGQWRSLGTFATTATRSFPVRQAVAVLVKS